MPERILHVCDKFGVSGSSIHGVSRLFSWWFPRHDSARFELSLCGLKRPEPASRLLKQQGIPVTHLGRGRFDPRTLRDLLALVRRVQPAILHVHGYAAADFGRVVARRTGVPLVLHEHFADPAMPAYQGLADRLLAGLTDRAIAVSGSTRDFLIHERHVPAERVRVIWNGAPLDEFAPGPPERRAAARAAVGLPADALVIGAIGRLNEQKGHRYLIAALPELCAARPELRVLIVGDGNLAQLLERQARDLGIAERVVFAGHRSDVPEMLSAIDILCIPSLYEGTPLALFEAMAAARPIVATAVDGCAEVLQDDVTGLLVPPKDPAALGGALRRLCDSPADRTRLGAAARDESRRYDIASTVRQIEALYDEVLAERRMGRAA